MTGYNKAFEAILNIYTKSNMKSFPIDCFYILKQCKIRSYSYHTIYVEKPKLYQLLTQYSADALRIGDTIYYDNKKSKTRIRFSLMHELGHIVLNHGKNPTPNMEAEANYFASNILAPRMLIYYSGCKNHADVCSLFKLSEEAALYAFNSYKRWFRNTIHKGYSNNDLKMYEYFYNQNLNKVVYKISYCRLCTDEFYNSESPYCSSCQNSYKRRIQEAKKTDQNFLKAELDWLYHET